MEAGGAVQDRPGGRGLGGVQGHLGGPVDWACWLGSRELLRPRDPRRPAWRVEVEGKVRPRWVGRGEQGTERGGVRVGAAGPLQEAGRW